MPTNRSDLSVITSVCASITSSLLIFPLTAVAQNASTAISVQKIVQPGSHIYAGACQPAQIELQLQQREHALLGKHHAAEHAQMRVHQCEVERGLREVPAKFLVKSAAETLKEDLAIRKVIIERGTVMRQ